MYAKPVGAGLLAKALYPALLQWMINRARQQADSYWRFVGWVKASQAP